MQGWQCPTCLRVYAPHVSQCRHCGNMPGVTIGTTTHWPTCPRCAKAMNETPGPECGQVHSPTAADYEAFRRLIAAPESDAPDVHEPERPERAPDLVAALKESIARARQRRTDNTPCPDCGGDRLRADFTNPDRCHAPRRADQ